MAINYCNYGLAALNDEFAPTKLIHSINELTKVLIKVTSVFLLARQSQDVFLPRMNRVVMLYTYFLLHCVMASPGI